MAEVFSYRNLANIPCTQIYPAGFFSYFRKKNTLHTPCTSITCGVYKTVQGVYLWCRGLGFQATTQHGETYKKPGMLWSRGKGIPSRGARLLTWADKGKEPRAGGSAALNYATSQKQQASAQQVQHVASAGKGGHLSGTHRSNKHHVPALLLRAVAACGLPLLPRPVPATCSRLLPFVSSDW